MDLGCFSISLSVKDINASCVFYETLGFKILDGTLERRWLVMQNAECKIGLFEGMFEGNMLTFNPPDVRAVQVALKGAGYAMEKEADEDVGSAHATLKDPDGNVLMLDQY